jgi:5,10-methylene-tetrahydrofolate dehydrogenase/methenyl tetrahydrofolate cyclohydrolase
LSEFAGSYLFGPVHRRATWQGENSGFEVAGARRALVTGGSEGIGKGIALALAQEGVDVAICTRRNEPLEAAAKDIAKATGW